METAACYGQPTVLVSSRSRAFAQVTQSPGLSLARRKPGVQIPSPPPQTSQVRASPASSGRRSRHLPAALRPQAHVTVQPGGLSATPGDSILGRTMTTQRGHRQLPTDGRSSPASRLSRSATRSTWPTAQPPPTTTTKSKPTRRWPSTACASLEGQAPTSGRRRASWTRRATTPTPAIPAVHLPAPPPRPTTSFPSDTTDAGGRTLDTWTLRTPAPDTGHLDRPRGTPDAGRRTGTRTRRQHSRRPDLLGRHAERPHAETPNRVCALPLPAGSSAAPPAKQRPGALLSCVGFWMVRGEGNETKER
jgi:hypothetical protein